VVVEAPGGYGKTVLAREVVDSWRAVGIEVTLDRPGVTAALLAGRLRSATERAGYTEAAAAAEGNREPADIVDSLLAVLAKERCAIVIDDAHNAERDAAQLVDYLAGQLFKEQRLVVLGRRLPKGAERFRREENLHLGATDLRLSSEECIALCRTGFALTDSDEAIKTLEKATAGWTAATVLAAGRAARTKKPLSSFTPGKGEKPNAAAAVAVMLDETLSSLGPGDRPLLAQLAHLPLLDEELVDQAVGRAGFFHQCTLAGLPFTPAREQWLELPGPVSEHLATLSPPDGEVIKRAARQYSLRGELGLALELLLACKQPEEAAALLASASPGTIEHLDAPELDAICEQLTKEAVEAHPEVLLVAGRALRLATRFQKAAALFGRARALAEKVGDEQLARATAAELAHDLLPLMRKEEAAAVARAVLETAGGDERLTRARAYHALGYALCWRVKDDGRPDEAALLESEDCLSKGSALYRALGARSFFSALAVSWAMGLEFPRGNALAAMKRLEEALPLVADNPRRWGYVMIFRAWLAAELGLDEVAKASVEEVLRLGEHLHSDLFLAHGHWKAAFLASCQEDPEATLEHLRAAESHKGAWWEPASGDFLAEATDMLGRVGQPALAWEYLARVKAEPKDAAGAVAFSEAGLQARFGDPELAEDQLLQLEQGRIVAREQWRVTLLRALAALRRGEEDNAGALAARAFEQAARLGQPKAPLIRERSATYRLLGLAVATGQPAALALETSSLPVALCVLGRFQLTIGGREVQLRPGQEGRLLRLLAAKGGRLQAEQAIEVIWPHAGRSAGRTRLRTLLSRVRGSAGDVVLREGAMLILGPSVHVDLEDFLSEGRRALALAPSDLGLAAAVARGVVARYRGDALVEDLYEDWADVPRERARQLMLDLLDLCERDAAQRGDLDTVRRVVQRTIELAPYDDSRYLRAASALLGQGRKGEALSVVKRARSAFAELGLAPPASLVDLERSIA